MLDPGSMVFAWTSSGASAFAGWMATLTRLRRWLTRRCSYRTNQPSSS